MVFPLPPHPQPLTRSTAALNHSKLFRQSRSNGDKGGNNILKGAGCSCGYVCLGSSDQTCELYQNPLSCLEYKKARSQNRMRALEHKGQKQFFVDSLA